MLHGTNGFFTRFIAVCSISTVFAVSLSVFPSAVAADVVSVQTQQVLPQGGTSCAPLSAYGFTPYIYEGALHSFEFTVPDTSYVALAGTVGNTPIPFQYMTRQGNSPDFLRVHVDIQTTSINTPLPLSVTLLSAKGTGVCMSVVIMSTSSSAGVVQPLPPPQIPPVITPAPTPTPPPASPPPVTYLTPSSGIGDVPATSVPSTGTPPATGTSSLSIASIQNRIVEVCAMTGGALRLWIILLAVYLAVVAVAVLAQAPALHAYSKGQRAATILTPLILILGFWYFAESCRATPWAPLTAVLIAAVGLLALYWNDPRMAPYASSFKGTEKKPDPGSTPLSASKPMITPPPTEKPDA